MVLTPFHYPLAYLINKVSGNKLKLDYVTLSVFLPDIEIPILFLLGYYPYRLILHSIIGSLVFSFPTLLLLWPIYRFFILETLGIEVRLDNMYNVFIGSVIGSLSHVFLDALHHDYNPLLWPFSLQSIDAIVLFNNWRLASEILNFVFLVITLILFLDTFNKKKSLIETIRSMISS